MSTPHIAFLRSAFLRHGPRTQARMTPHGQHKYYRIARPITDQQLAQHLAGALTLACPLQHQGRGYIAAADLDVGGAAHLRALLGTCAQRGLFAFAIAVRAGDHDGGHLFIPFAQEQDAGALRQLARSIAGDVECYPNGADLRLPFGQHLRAHTRGQLLLQDGAAIDLDSDLELGIAALQLAWRPNPDQLDQAQPEARQRRPVGRSEARTLIPAILAGFDLEERLMAYGARSASRGLYTCPFHDDRAPSLVVYQDRAGMTVCRCMSQHSGCPLAERGRNDLINVVAIGEGISTSEAAVRLGVELRASQPSTSLASPSRTSSQPTPRAPAPEPAPAGVQVEALRQAALLRLALDTTLPTCARATYRALDSAAGLRGRCAVSVRWLEVAANLTERSIQRGLRILEACGYIVTQQRRGHTSRYSLRWGAAPEGHGVTAPAADPLPLEIDCHPPAPAEQQPEGHGVTERSPNMLVGMSHAGEGGSTDSSDPLPLEIDCHPPAQVEQQPEGHGVTERSPNMLVGMSHAGEGGPTDSSDPLPLETNCHPPAQVEQAPAEQPYWNKARLQSMATVRRGPPKPPPSRPSRRPQARFTQQDGQLKQRFTRQLAGPAPSPSPSAPAPAEAPPAPRWISERHKRSSGKGARHACPPSPADRYRPAPLPDDDPWIKLQRHLLANAIEQGNHERAQFYRTVLINAGKHVDDVTDAHQGAAIGC